MRVAKEAYPDPTVKEGDWSCVDLEPVKPLAAPVTLEQIKADRLLREMPLIKQSRLSVMPLTKVQFRRVLELAGTRMGGCALRSCVTHKATQLQSTKPGRGQIPGLQLASSTPTILPFMNATRILCAAVLLLTGVRAQSVTLEEISGSYFGKGEIAFNSGAVLDLDCVTNIDPYGGCYILFSDKDRGRSEFIGIVHLTLNNFQESGAFGSSLGVGQADSEGNQLRLLMHYRSGTILTLHIHRTDNPKKLLFP